MPDVMGVGGFEGDPLEGLLARLVPNAPDERRFHNDIAGMDQFAVRRELHLVRLALDLLERRDPRRPWLEARVELLAAAAI